MHSLRLSLVSRGLAFMMVVAPSCEQSRARSDAPAPLFTESRAGASLAPSLGVSSDTPREAPDYARGCLALRDVAASDVVRIEGSTLYYLDEGSGLWIVDISDAARPRVEGHVEHVGEPLFLFVREGLAWAVFVDSDQRASRHPMATVIRAIDVRDPSRPRLIGEIARSGIAHDASLVGGVLYLLRDAEAGATVESFDAHGGTLAMVDRTALQGHAVQLAASSTGLAAVTLTDDAVGVAWIDLPTDAIGSLRQRDVASLRGRVPLRPAAGSRVVAADDGATVSVVACNATCDSSDGAHVQLVDFGTGHAALGARLALGRRGGFPVVRFDDARLYVASADAAAGQLRTTLSVISLAPTLAMIGTVRLRGAVHTLARRAETLVAFGTVPSQVGGTRLIVHDVEVGNDRAPRSRGTFTFGSDWTWSAAQGSEAALSFDPGSSFLAVPFTALREADHVYGVGVQLVDMSPVGPLDGPTVFTQEYVERAVFVGGRLLTIGPAGVGVVDYANGGRPSSFSIADDTLVGELH